MEPLTIEAKTIDEVRKKAAEELGVTEDKVKIEVIQEAGGLLSRFTWGGKVKAKAWIEENAEPEAGEAGYASETVAAFEGAPEAADPGDPISEDDPWNPGVVLQSICRSIVPDTRVYMRQENGQTIYYIKGDGSGIFIGRKGQTLNALQFIVSRIVAKRKGIEPEQFAVDSEGYRERRAKTLREQAHDLADWVVKTGKSQSTDPLNAYERRIIHVALRDRANIITKSIGTGDVKRVQIMQMRRGHN